MLEPLAPFENKVLENGDREIFESEFESKKERRF